MPETMAAANHGVGCMTVFVGLRGSNEDNQLKALNVWQFPQNQLDHDDALEAWMKIVRALLLHFVVLLYI